MVHLITKFLSSNRSQPNSATAPFSNSEIQKTYIQLKRAANKVGCNTGLMYHKTSNCNLRVNFLHFANKKRWPLKKEIPNVE